MITSKSYRTLFLFQLSQTSDFSTGGTDMSTELDMPVARDGKERLVIKGTSLTGAMLHTARALGYTLPQNVSDTHSSDAPESSVWKVANCHLVGQEPELLTRQYVAIEDDTGTAKESALFDMQVVPKDTLWEGLVDVDAFYDDDNQRASLIATHVLHHWHTHGIRLGRRSVAGTGWFKLTDLKVLKLNLNNDKGQTVKTLSMWPNSSKTPLEQAKFLISQAVKEPHIKAQNALTPDISDLLSTLHLSKSEMAAIPNLFQKRLNLSLSVGRNQSSTSSETDNYGLDTLFIGGYQASKKVTDNQGNQTKKVDEERNKSLNLQRLKQSEANFIWPTNYQFDESNDIPDQFFVMDHENCPFIPGSSLRGAIVAQLNLLSNQHNQSIVDSLKGSTEQSSHLYVSDAHLKNNNWQAMVYHNHAEDEFTRAVFGSGKFVRTAICQGEFNAEIIIEHPDKTIVEQQLNALKQVLDRAELGLIPLGGKKWVDCGWIDWSYQESSVGLTGSDGLATRV